MEFGFAANGRTWRGGFVNSAPALWHIHRMASRARAGVAVHLNDPAGVPGVAPDKCHTQSPLTVTPLI